MDERPVEEALRERLERQDADLEALHDRVARLQDRLGQVTRSLAEARLATAKEAAAKLVALARADDADERLLNFEAIGGGRS